MQHKYTTGSIAILVQCCIMLCNLLYENSLLSREVQGLAIYFVYKESIMKKLSTFFASHYRGENIKAQPFIGVATASNGSDCAPAQCVCNCGGSWCAPSVKKDDLSQK